MIENYVKYLEFIDEKLARFFEAQKPYIFCKKGCAKCCKQARFPYSLMEVNYLLRGSMQLPAEKQDIIAINIKKILDERKNFSGQKFYHDCPFLIDDECSVYEYRGLICRSFGLLTFDSNKNIQAPFCYEFGLNYSNVLDVETGKISIEKFKGVKGVNEGVGELGLQASKNYIKEVPTVFNVSYETLVDEDLAKGFNFRFGEIKPLIEWFIKEDDK